MRIRLLAIVAGFALALFEFASRNFLLTAVFAIAGSLAFAFLTPRKTPGKHASS